MRTTLKLRGCDNCRFTALAAGIGLLLLVAAYWLSFEVPGRGDFLTRQTARVAVLYWGLAAATILLERRTYARSIWAIGCVAFLIHVATAFEYVHHRSHSAAYQHVQEVSGAGAGIYVSYGFTLLWVVDAIWWLSDRASYEVRSKWLDRTIHALMAFVVFNGTVVYEEGFIRWASAAMFLTLGVLAFHRHCRKTLSTTIEGQP